MLIENQLDAAHLSAAKWFKLTRSSGDTTLHIVKSVPSSTTTPGPCSFAHQHGSTKAARLADWWVQCQGRNSFQCAVPMIHLVFNMTSASTGLLKTCGKLRNSKLQPIMAACVKKLAPCLRHDGAKGQ